VILLSGCFKELRLFGGRQTLLYDKQIMSGFFLKRFEISGLNCFLTHVSLAGTTTIELSKVLQFISRCDKRFAFETTDNWYAHQKNAALRLPQNSTATGNSRVFARMGDFQTTSLPGANRLKRKWQSELPIRRLKRITWNDPTEPSSLLSAVWNCEMPNQLEAVDDETSRMDFRYSIMDAQERLLVSSLDSTRPIFSNRGPVVESGFSIRIDLVPVSEESPCHLPVLARLARRKSELNNESFFCLNKKNNVSEDR